MNTTRAILMHYLKRVSRFSWMATSVGVVVIVAVLGIGSVVAHRSLFTAEYLRRFVVPLVAYNAALYLLALPYLVLRATKRP